MKLDRNTKVILVSFGPLVVLILLFVFLGKFAFGKISDVRLKISTAKKSETILQEKADLLNQVQSQVLTSSGISLSALPEENPSLAVISQLKRLALEVGVNLTNIKSGGEVKDKSGLKRVDVNFEVTGVRSAVLHFLESVEGVAPLSLVEKVKLNESGGITHGSVIVKSFWAALPTKLPPLEAGINDLTKDEKETLIKISSLTQPLFLEVPAGESSSREDPFAP